MTWCCRCKIPFDSMKEPGALLFSPPPGPCFEAGPVQKYHLCPKCWDALQEWLKVAELERKNKKIKLTPAKG